MGTHKTTDGGDRKSTKKEGLRSKNIFGEKPSWKKRREK